MESAVVVLVLSVIMLSGGRKLIRDAPGSKLEGALSFAIGLGLSLSWYVAYPQDFSDLAGFLLWTARRLWYSSDSFFSAIILAALLPVAIGFLLLLVIYRLERREPTAVRSVFGPIGRIRRPKVLR